MTKRTAAKWDARTFIKIAFEVHGKTEVALMAVVERIDTGEATTLAFDTLVGAARAAARAEGRKITTVRGQEYIV
jgi:hypothetical protein